MKVVIPMAGTGNRFVVAGYSAPKPLIKVNGKYIIEYIRNMFAPDDEIVFICNEAHMKNTDMAEVLNKISPGCQVITIPNHKKGAVFTVFNTDMDQYIDNDEEVIICYCDNPYLWNYNNFKEFVKTNNSDGCVLTHKGFHPHRLSPTFMAHIKEEDNKLIEIKEKEPYTNDPMGEHASTGTYYFKKGFYVKKYFRQLLEENIHYKGEFYATLVYNLLVKDGLLVNVYATDFVSVFGTPEEVQNFEAWQTLLSSTQIKNEEDLVKCYRYWKEYNEKRNS